MKKIMTAITVAALMATAPAIAQASKAPVPAAETGIGSDGESALFKMGAAGYVVAALLAGLLIWGIVELADDDKSVSPE